MEKNGNGAGKPRNPSVFLVSISTRTPRVKHTRNIESSLHPPAEGFGEAAHHHFRPTFFVLPTGVTFPVLGTKALVPRDSIFVVYLVARAESGERRRTQ